MRIKFGKMSHELSYARGGMGEADILAFIGGDWRRVGWIEIRADMLMYEGVLTSGGDRYETSCVTVNLFGDNFGVTGYCIELWSADVLRSPRRGSHRILTTAGGKREAKRLIAIVSNNGETLEPAHDLARH